MSRKVLVVGVGNVLRQDDGVGVHLVRALEGRLPPHAEAVDAGTCVLDVLDGVDRSSRLILVDAVAGGRAAGTIYRVPLTALVSRPPTSPASGRGARPKARVERGQDPDEVGPSLVQAGRSAEPGDDRQSPSTERPGSGPSLSLHDLDLTTSVELALAAGGRPGQLDDAVLIGVEPAALDWGTDLSPEVGSRLPAVVETVLAEIAREEA